MNLRQRIRFYQQLAVLTRAGVPLRTALPRLEERMRGQEIGLLTQKIAAGETVGEAFAAARFSPFECHLVTAGERSAHLETVFQHLSEFWARQREMFQAIASQLYYPVVVFVLALIVASVLEGTVAPWYVAVTHLVERLVIYGAAVFVLYTLVQVSWHSEAAQRFWLAVPMIGGTLASAYAYRWITALRLEHGAGIPMPDAVADAWRASGYAGREELAREGQLALREGSELSVLVQRWRRLPREWVDFIETGEVSGALETAFANLEAEAARSWGLAQARMTDWLPKIFYFLILLVIGFQIYSMATQTVARIYTDPMNAINSAMNQ